MHIKNPSQCHSIEEIRDEIDRIDEQLIRLLGNRFIFVKEIVKYKKSVDEVIAKERFEQVIESRRKMALQNGLSPEIIEQIYRLLMNYFIEEEQKLLEQKNNSINQ